MSDEAEDGMRANDGKAGDELVERLEEALQKLCDAYRSDTRGLSYERAEPYVHATSLLTELRRTRENAAASPSPEDGE